MTRRAFLDFCGVESSNQVPDGDTLGRFQNILAHNGLQEQLFTQVVKGLLRYRKTRYRGLQKQTAKLNMMFALANLIWSAVAKKIRNDSALFAHTGRTRGFFMLLCGVALNILVILSQKGNLVKSSIKCY